jgi:hypothetical protein
MSAADRLLLGDSHTMTVPPGVAFSHRQHLHGLHQMNHLTSPAATLANVAGRFSGCAEMSGSSSSPAAPEDCNDAEELADKLRLDSNMRGTFC